MFSSLPNVSVSMAFSMQLTPMQVLQSDGGERAACINAAMLAVANAGAMHKPVLQNLNWMTDQRLPNWQHIPFTVRV